MKLDRVTITGADDTIEPKRLIEIAFEFPFVEWGILFSKNHQGKPRWASYEWLDKLFSTPGNELLNLSAHLCGKWVKEFVVNGNNAFAVEYPGLWKKFQRVQLNFHAEYHIQALNFESLIAQDNKHYIFQYDGVNSNLQYIKLKNKAFPLFDISGGAGILPESWPTPFGEYCGYAGGLGPDNLNDQLQKIEKVVGNSRIWIDMETRVRSEDDRTFELPKVIKCLSIAEKFIV